MSAVWALRFEEVSKSYRPAAGYRSLRQDLAALARGRRARRPRPPARRALDSVSFEVAEGEALAVIGPNGAGKSTALRIAARVTAPSAGRVRVRGRIGALIEVGAGIHPELTGRENIWLYGAILGLSRREIAARFDEIVAFAELEAALDQQVKRYSSGMQLRLGFAIAAGVAPDVLVVDEALAVGDARFQLRCLARMAELVRSGSALVYVSHDLASVEAVCARAALLLEGRVAHLGPAAETVGAYLRWVEQGADEAACGAMLDAAGRPCAVFAPGDPAVVRVPLPAAAAGGPGPGRAGPITVALGIRDGHAWNVLGAAGSFPPHAAGGDACCRIAALPLTAGVYQVWGAVEGDAGAEGGWRRIASFRVEDAAAPARPPWLPPVAFAYEWERRPPP
ncbi:MAG: ABC transporter ATP-binding protein [Acidimicrobiales bacterium]